MKATCPHCGKELDLVGKKELEAEPFNLTVNQQQFLRDQGKFPPPWLKLENRYIYLRSDMEKFLAAGVKEKAEAAVEDLMKSLSGVSEEQREETLKMLRELGKEE
jgi:hypothetical protein